MKVTTRGRYAVAAMVDLAFYGNGQPVSMPEISKRQDIPLPYLEQIFSQLRKKGLLNSLRGAKGGYILSQTADKILVADIINAVDEEIDVTQCKDLKTGEGCLRNKPCLTHDLWDGLGRMIKLYLASITLDDICKNKLGANMFQHREMTL